MNNDQITKEQYEAAEAVIKFPKFSPSKEFAVSTAEAFNAAISVGSPVIVKNINEPDVYYSTVISGPAFVQSIQFGYIAMVPLARGVTSAKCVKRHA